MKKKVIKDYKNLPEELKEALREQYPQGYLNDIISFFDKDKHLVSALPYETEEVSYLIKMPASLHMGEDDDSSEGDMNSLSEGDRMEDINEEQFLLQEEEEEESD